MKWVGLVTGVLVGLALVAVEFSIFAPLMTIRPSAPDQRAATGPISPALHDKFITFQAGRFDELPMRVDDRMTLVDITMEAQTISFYFSLKNPNRASSIVALRGLEPAIREKLCTDPRFLVLAEDGAWAAFYVDDLSGLSIERFTIDPATC